MQFYDPAETVYSRFSPYQGGHEGNVLGRRNHRFQDLNDYCNLDYFLPREFMWQMGSIYYCSRVL